jgi:hypothetical protein
MLIYGSDHIFLLLLRVSLDRYVKIDPDLFGLEG